MGDCDPRWLSKLSLENSALDRRRFYEMKFSNYVMYSNFKNEIGRSNINPFLLLILSFSFSIVW